MKTMAKLPGWANRMDQMVREGKLSTAGLDGLLNNYDLAMLLGQAMMDGLINREALAELVLPRSAAVLFAKAGLFEDKGNGLNYPEYLGEIPEFPLATGGLEAYDLVLMEKRLEIDALFDLLGIYPSRSDEEYEGYVQELKDLAVADHTFQKVCYWFMVERVASGGRPTSSGNRFQPLTLRETLMWLLFYRYKVPVGHRVVVLNTSITVGRDEIVPTLIRQDQSRLALSLVPKKECHLTTEKAVFLINHRNF